MDNPGPFAGIYSGQIIGAVVKALALEQSVLKDRTAQRFFAGQPVNEHSRTEIFLALGAALVERGIVPVPPMFLQYDADIAVFIAASIARAAARWDTLLAVIQSRSSTIANPAMAAERLLRLVVVDLSLRVFALARLAGLEPPPPETPLWAQQNGGGKLLRQFTEQAGLTRDQLAARLEVSYTAVDNWLDSKNRPTPYHVAALAKELAGVAKTADARQREQTIQRQLTFAHLADLLEPGLGRERITELSAALVRFVRLITEDVRAMERPPLEKAAGMEIDAFRLGTDHIPSHTLLRNLALVERDAGWRRDILTAARDWRLPFQEIASQAGQPRSAAGLAQDVLDLSFADPAAEALLRLADELPNSQYWLEDPGDLSQAFGRLERGIALRRAIVREFPLSPRAHYELGSFAGMVGKHLRFWGEGRGFIQEGISECKIAAALLPEWDAPAVEPGIILINIGEYAAALAELNRAQEVLPKATPHLLINTGYARMQLSQYAAALTNFEQVIAARPDYAMAYKFAAHCAFSLGDRRKGLRYAKRARQLGEPAVFNHWRQGNYPSGHPGSGKP